MQRLKGIRIKRTVTGTYEVTPLFFGKRGGTVSATALREVGTDLKAVLSAVLAKLLVRGNLKA